MQLTPAKNTHWNPFAKLFSRVAKDGLRPSNWGVPDALAEALEFNRGREAARSF